MRYDREMSFSDADLLAFLDELLPPERSSQIEAAIRADAGLRQRCAGLLRGRDAGAHTLADIWRRHRVSCFDHDTLGGYLLGTLAAPLAASIELHLEAVGCRWCRAEVDALLAARRDTTAASRRQRLFESSVGHAGR